MLVWANGAFLTLVLDDLYVQLQTEQFIDKPKIAFDPAFSE